MNAPNINLPIEIILILVILIIWSIGWKGFALWRSAQRGDKTWFILLFLVNTIGILDIIYYYWISKQKEKSS